MPSVLPPLLLPPPVGLVPALLPVPPLALPPAGAGGLTRPLLPPVPVAEPPLERPELPWWDESSDEPPVVLVGSVLPDSPAANFSPLHAGSATHIIRSQAQMGI